MTNAIEKALRDYWPYLLGGVVLYFAFKKVTEVAQAALVPVSDAIASAYLDATLPDAVNIQASIILPNGVHISANDIQLNDSMQFRYGGVLYTLTGRNADNNYVAVIA